MNRRDKLVLLKNAGANVLRGGAAGLIAVLLPPFLARMMSPDSYGAWSLVLQLSALVAYFDFGIQTAVGRFVAHANEKGDSDHRDRVVSTSFMTLAIAGGAAILAAILVAAFLPSIFPQMPHVFLNDTRIALLLVGGSLAIGLPASVFNGIFVGIQRYDLLATIIGGSRVVSAIAIMLVVKHRGGLTAMGLAVALVNLLSYATQYLMYRKTTAGYRISKQLVSIRTGRELFDYCFSLTVWSFGMLLVSGLDLALVGYFQFNAVVYYAVVATLITFLIGLQNALFSVMVPSTAAVHARGDAKTLGRIVVTTTRYGAFILLLTGLPLVFWGEAILRVWVGPSYAIHGARLLQVLVIANIVRLLPVPYVMALIGSGQQKLVIVTPLLEGFSNLFISIGAGYVLGAIGVALGTLFGALAGAGGHVLYNMPRTKGIDFRILDYVRDGLVRPAACALPAIVLVVIAHFVNGFTRLTIDIGSVATLLVTAWLVWHWGLVGSERQKLLEMRLAPQSGAP